MNNLARRLMLAAVLLALLVVVSIDKTQNTNAKIAQETSQTMPNESLHGDVHMYTARGGLFVIAIDSDPKDDNVDHYYWYRTSGAFPTGLKYDVANVNLSFHNKILTLSNPQNGVRILFKIDAIESPLPHVISRDLPTLISGLTRFVIPVPVFSNSRHESVFELSGGFEIGRSLPEYQKPLSQAGGIGCPEGVACADPDPGGAPTCNAGGTGSIACSVGNSHGNCSITCGAGYFSCCKYGTSQNDAECTCRQGT